MDKKNGATKVPGKRGRTHLTQDDKAFMAERRTAAAGEKKAALEFLKTNPQFQNPKFWGTVDASLSAAVVDAIAKGGEKAKAVEIKRLKAEIAALEG